MRESSFALCGATIVNEAHHSRSFWYTFPSRFSDLCGMIGNAASAFPIMPYSMLFLRCAWGGDLCYYR